MVGLDLKREAETLNGRLSLLRRLQTTQGVFLQSNYHIDAGKTA